MEKKHKYHQFWLWYLLNGGLFYVASLINTLFVLTYQIYIMNVFVIHKGFSVFLQLNASLQMQTTSGKCSFETPLIIQIET